MAIVRGLRLGHRPARAGAEQQSRGLSFRVEERWLRYASAVTHGAVRQIGIDRRDDQMCFDRDEVDAADGHAHPGGNNNAFVQESVEDVNERRMSVSPFDTHNGRWIE